MGNSWLKRKTVLISMMGIIIAVLLVLMSLRNYQDLLDALVESEQNHLETIAISTAKGIETYFAEEERSLRILVQDYKFKEYFDELSITGEIPISSPVEMYYTIGYPRVQKLQILDRDGLIMDEFPLSASKDSSILKDEMDVKNVLTMDAKAFSDVIFDKSGTYIFMSYPIVVEEELQGVIRAKINIDFLYEYYVEPIKSGNKGYASVKSRDGIFLMHPVESQLGKNVLELRKSQYPEYDWSELEELFERQKIGDSGSAVYHSVWVTEEKPVRTTKFNGYASAEVGDDYWIVTVSSDYNEAVKGIRKNYNYTILIVVFIIASIIFSLFYIFMMRQKDKELKTKSNYLEKVENLNYELEEDIEMRKKLEGELVDRMEEDRKREALMLHQSRYIAMGEMIGNIAHQWRQPLNALTMIISNIEDISEDDEMDEELLEKLFSKARLLINNMSETIEDFRYFVKPRVDKEYFKLSKCINTTLQLCEERLNMESVNVNVSGNSNLKLFGQANQLSQVVINLVNNAIDAFSERNISDRHIDIAYHESAETCVIEVKDNAGGIDEEVMKRIFEPYFTTKEGKNGTGLGMYMSKIIVEKYFGGNMEVANISRGIEIRIVIPLVSEGDDMDE
jgi:C4-dicarboxylate-specific signal transduction histidine kinase